MLHFSNLYNTNTIAKYVMAIMLFACTTNIKAQTKLRFTKTDNYIAIGLPYLKPVLFLPIQQGFVEIAKVNRKAKYKMASFHFKEKEQKNCGKNTIDIIDNKAEQGIVIKGGFENCACKYTLKAIAVDSNTINLKIRLDDSTYNKLVINQLSETDEQIFGLGEQYSQVNLKGHKVPVFVEEQGAGRGDQPITFFAKLVGSAGNNYTSYVAIPFFLTNGSAKKNIPQRALMLENKTYSSFDFTDQKQIRIEVWDNYLEAVVWTDDNPLKIIERYTKKTGRMPVLPDWAYGTWIGLQGGADKAKRVVKQAQNAGNPVTALWIQDWEGKRDTRFGSQLWWNWEADENLYPNFKDFCGTMNQNGVQVLGYVNSFLANEKNLYEIAKKNNYLIKNNKGQDYEIETAGFPAYLVDLSNPDAYQWLKEVIKNNMIGMGLSGWMADFGEWLPLDAVLYSGVNPKIYHNEYPVVWAKLNREAVEETNNQGNIVFFNRSGFTYSNKYATLFWLGDQMVDWKPNDGLASTVPALLSGGISGISLNHSDIGGYTTMNLPFAKYHRSQELLFRWAELNAFTTIYRTHEGLRPKENEQVYGNQQNVDFFAKMGQLHYAMKPYFKHLVSEASLKGYPVVRHLYLHYPNDKNTYNLQYQFLLGDAILVLPVLHENKETVKGYFPEGKWQSIWTGAVLDGKQWYTVPAVLGQPAAYIKLNHEWTEQLNELLNVPEKK